MFSMIRSGRNAKCALVALFAVALLVAYWPATNGGFVWDDDMHISGNPALRTLGGLRDIWFKPGATCQYYPLSFTAFWAGYHLWGLNTPGYHLLNVLLHGGVAVLLWQVLARLRMRGAWLAGALFALHPVCVMSVAWMTELKNTLSGLFMLGSVWAYLRFAGLGVYERHAPDGDGASGCRRRRRYYVLCLVLFQLAMFAKTAVSFLPVTLLLVTWWRREKLAWRDVVPLLPMVVIAVALGQVTFAVERSSGAQGAQYHLGLLQRVLISGRSYWFYLGKLLAPCQLTFIYPRWTVAVGAWQQWLYPAGALALLGGLWTWRKRLGKGLFVAMTHFYVTTSMLILLTVLYMTRFSWVSDHWQYYGCMAVMGLAGAGISAVADRWGAGRAWLLPALCGVLLSTLGVLTWRQSRMYADIETLYRVTIDRNPGCWMAHGNLGMVLFKHGQTDEAIAHYRQALRLKPDFGEAHNNLGLALIGLGQYDEAVAHCRKALETGPNSADTHNNLGLALAGQGEMDEAISHYRKAIALKSDFADPHSNLGNALAARGEIEHAIVQYRQALSIWPDFAEAHNNLGAALFRLKRVDEAIACFRRAVEIKPDYPDARHNLEVASNVQRETLPAADSSQRSESAENPCIGSRGTRGP